MEQHATGWLYVIALKELRIHEWQEDHLFEGLDIPIQASNLIKANAWVNLHHMTACCSASINREMALWSLSICNTCFSMES